MADTRGQRDASVNVQQRCGVAGYRSDNNTTPPVAIDLALAAEGARIAARRLREQALRDMLASIEEFWRASGADRRYWRGQARWLIGQWRCLYERPERAAFQAVVARSRACA